MALHDWVQLMIGTGVSCIMIAGLMLIALGGSFNGNRSIIGSLLTLLSDKELRSILKEDLHNPKIVAGGMLGIVIKMLKLGLIFISAGGLLWGISLL